MTRPSATSTKRTRGRRPHDVAGLLALAASPVFGLMTWVTANGGTATAFCGSMPGIASIDGMAMMYLLMSLLHLPPWFRLMSSRPRDRTLSNATGDRS